MICAIDFGSCWVRSISRSPGNSERLSMYVEKSEYALISNTEPFRKTLLEQQLPFAECDGSLIVAGNNSAKAAWLSRVPCTPLLSDGSVPSDDPPARQMLNVMVEAMLPPRDGKSNLCGITLPGMIDGSSQTGRSESFLCRLVRMRGYSPVLVRPAEAALLSSGSDIAFTGISIVMGAESTHICIARHGLVISHETLAIGSNWIDTELARQFKIYIWDEDGNSYLDLESVRNWKVSSSVHLRNATGERERMMSRLYTVVLDRISRTVAEMLDSTPVRNMIQKQRLPVILSGGATMLDGFAGLLTDRFIEHEIAKKISAIRSSHDPASAVIRGALICAELEARSIASAEAA